MKIFVSLLLTFAFQLSWASDHAKEHTEGVKAHKDWNQVFKQPTADKSLTTVPDKTQILEPSFLSQIKGTEVTLKWKAIDGVKYHLQVATDPNYKWLVTNETLIALTEYSLKGLQKNQQYFWRVYTQKPENTKSYTKGPAVSSAFETIQ